MSATVINHVPGMFRHRGKVLRAFGKDQTNQITYKFNQQGFRDDKDFDFVPNYAFFGCSLVFGIGVAQENTFTYLFENSQNYGLAGQYDNHDVMTTVENFLNSDIYSSNSKLVVVWHSRDSDDLDKFYDRLSDYNVLHFFCGAPLSRPNCHAFPRELDQDVSGTHPGPNTHKVFSRMLCAIFKQ